jgi:hypothetical protein
MRIFQDVAQPYNEYMTTRDLANLRSANGLTRVAKNDMRPGDLLVYGFYDQDNAWHGHVVVLVDKEYVHGSGKRGLVVGSHGTFGVAFITFEGFPETYREDGKLVAVLRATNSFRKQQSP